MSLTLVLAAALSDLAEPSATLTVVVGFAGSATPYDYGGGCIGGNHSFARQRSRDPAVSLEAFPVRPS